MTTSDPVLFPIPLGNAESLRQDANRTRADLAATVGALAERFDLGGQLRRRAGAAWRATAPVLGAGAAGGAVLAATCLPWRGRTLASDWGGRAAAGAGAIAASGVAYLAIDRRTRPRRPAAHRSPAAPNPGGAASSEIAVRVQANGRSTVDQRGTGVGTGNVSTRNEGGDVVDVLMAQHRRVDAIFAGVTTSVGRGRRDAFATLVDFLHRHERAEQEVVHPVLREFGGEYAAAVDARLDEEKAADRAIASLISRGVADPGFEEGLAQLRDMVHAHAAREESEEFPLLRARVSGRQLRIMAKKVRSAQKELW